MQMQPLIVPAPGRTELAFLFEDDEIQTGPAKTRAHGQACGPCTNHDNVGAFCHEPPRLRARYLPLLGLPRLRLRAIANSTDVGVKRVDTVMMLLRKPT